MARVGPWLSTATGEPRRVTAGPRLLGRLRARIRRHNGPVTTPPWDRELKRVCRREGSDNGQPPRHTRNDPLGPNARPGHPIGSAQYLPFQVLPAPVLHHRRRPTSSSASATFIEERFDRLGFHQWVNPKLGGYDFRPFVEQAMQCFMRVHIEHRHRSPAGPRENRSGNLVIQFVLNPRPKFLPLLANLRWASWRRRANQKKQHFHSPNLDRFEVHHQFRALQALALIPILAVSGSPGAHHCRRRSALEFMCVTMESGLAGTGGTKDVRY